MSDKSDIQPLNYPIVPLSHSPLSTILRSAASAGTAINSAELVSLSWIASNPGHSVSRLSLMNKGFNSGTYYAAVSGLVRRKWVLRRKGKLYLTSFGESELRRIFEIGHEMGEISDEYF